MWQYRRRWITEFGVVPVTLVTSILAIAGSVGLARLDILLFSRSLSEPRYIWAYSSDRSTALMLHVCASYFPRD